MSDAQDTKDRIIDLCEDIVCQNDDGEDISVSQLEDLKNEIEDLLTMLKHGEELPNGLFDEEADDFNNGEGE